MSKWIKVEDKLPEYDTKFLGYYENGEILTLWFWADTFEKCTELLMAGEMTHWMPLPDPPENV